MPAALPFSQKTWLSQTSVTARARSKEMQALDVAIWRYENASNDGNLRQLKTAFQAWKDKEGKGDAWRKSSRNGKGAITELDRALNPNFYPKGDSPTSYQAGLADSRRGLLWLFANTELHHGVSTYMDVLMEGAFSLGGNVVGLPKNLAQGTNLLSDQNSAIAGTVIAGVSSAYDKGRDIARNGSGANLLVKVKNEILDYFRSVWETITSVDRLKVMFTSSLADTLESAWGTASMIASNVANAMCLNAAPFLSAGIDTVNGVIDTIKAARARYKVWAAGRNVEYNPGHPGAIVSQIKTAMDAGIGQGLYQALKGAANITGQALSAGISSVVSMIVAGLEFIAKVVYRVVEVWRMRNFFAHCRDKYAELGADPASHPFFQNGVEFGEWYSKASRLMPCIPALAINSGVAGDKMRWINMYSGPAKSPSITSGGQLDYTSVVSQKTFDEGVEQLDLLKDWCKDYLIETKYRFFSKNSTAALYLDFKGRSEPRVVGAPQHA
jgi:hypothetical protein